jgi:hypothetical protein
MPARRRPPAIPSPPRRQSATSGGTDEAGEGSIFFGNGGVTKVDNCEERRAAKWSSFLLCAHSRIVFVTIDLLHLDGIDGGCRRPSAW